MIVRLGVEKIGVGSSNFSVEVGNWLIRKTLVKKAWPQNLFMAGLGEKCEANLNNLSMIAFYKYILVVNVWAYASVSDTMLL